MATKLNKVLVNVDQSDKDKGGFSDEEKATARANIGAISRDEVPTAVQSDWTQSNSSKIDYIKNKPVSKGDREHPVYIDANGAFQYVNKLIWSYNYNLDNSPLRITLTSDHFQNGYYEFPFSLGETGLKLGETGCLLMFKGTQVCQQYTPVTWNKACSLYMVSHDETEDPRFLLDSNVQTVLLTTDVESFAETPAGNSGGWWYGIKAQGLTYSNNGSYFDLRLRVPIVEGDSVGSEKELKGRFNVTIIGILPDDSIG